jgi:nifR3 family TIM-barrel protein
MPDAGFDFPSLIKTRPLLLAPMAGVNDPVFRCLCKRQGAALTTTEMISAMALHHGNGRTEEMLAYEAEEAPFAVQLFGRDPEVMAAQAAGLQARLGACLALIDLNMACPARKVVASGCGAALMRDPALARSIISAVAGGVSVPVTVKMRKGFANHEDSALEFAKMAQKAGASAVTVHGRCAEQFYHGFADRQVIRTLAAALDIPVIASGDVCSHADAMEYLELGASAVMVARGARGNPWIFNAPGQDAPSLSQRIAMAREHAQRLYALSPRRLVWMRRHMAWYFKGLPEAASLRRCLNSCQELPDYLALLDSMGA